MNSRLQKIGGKGPGSGAGLPPMDDSEIDTLSADGAQDTVRMTSEPAFKMELSESQFQGHVELLAMLFGWQYMHIRPGLNQRGKWRTPISGSLGAGWPDLILVRDSRMIFAELKSEKGRLTAPQVMVLNALEATGHEVFCWRPSDWDSITEVLR